MINYIIVLIEGLIFHTLYLIFVEISMQPKCKFLIFILLVLF